LLDKTKALSLSDLVLIRDFVNERIDVRVALCDYHILPFFRRIFGNTAMLKKGLEMVCVLMETDEVLATLTPREEKVIKMRFGLGNTGSSHTLEKVGRHYAVTRQRIQQIEKSALKKLRHPSRSRRLKVFLEGKQ
jgi:hypothetical protein